MKQAIEFLQQNADYLIIGPRKNQPHATFILVHQGLVLVRLGKLEIPVTKGQGFWLPSGCLSAVTTLQGSVTSTLTFSPRSISPLPNQAGFVEPSMLIQGIAEQLVMLEGQQETEWQGAYGRLLRCARDLFSSTLPNDNYDAPTRQLAANIAQLEKDPTSDVSIDANVGISKDNIAQQLLVRGLVKKLQSGQKLAKIAAQASMSEEALAQLLEQTVGAI